jgi:type I restriction enzyme, R subunit
MTLGPEYEQVERPLLKQLADLGWTHLEGAVPGVPKPTDPAKSGRASFSEVFLEERLKAQLRIINRGLDGKAWLDERRIGQAVGALTRIAAPTLLEANQAATELLLSGISVEGLPGWDGGREQRVRFIDWDNPKRNDFVVVSQFRVDIPGTQGRKCIVPDEVLFVNGIPLALVECKKPGSPMEEAIKQHLRYADRRTGQQDVATPAEGNPKLFHTMQLLVGTSGEAAMFGSITSGPTHYAPWRDPYPLTCEDLARRLSKPESALTQQDILTSVILHPAQLLDIVHNYVTFMPADDGTTIKAVPRYQQFRTVSKAIHRLEHGPTKAQDGEKDRRGGVIWHTQGSGKSLTMSFLVRKLRTVPGLRKTKVVIVTDRTQLQVQLSETMELSGEKVDTAKKISQARKYLSQHGPGIVFVMIQKQQDETTHRAAGRGTGRSAGDDEITQSAKALTNGALPKELNIDESIVVLIDEAHRSHGSALHAHLMAALPNCARIGFTGTPILMGKKKRTTDIFGPYIDMYRLADAERDKAVVPIFYQGRVTKGAVRDGRDMDEVFEDMLAEHTPAEMEQIKRRYATTGDVLEAKELIEAKAKNILRHYVGAVLPNGFKAQLVAYSRRATLRYRMALGEARDELVAQIGALSEATRSTDPEEIKDRKTAFLVRAARHLDLLKAIDFVPVISIGTHNDEKDFEPWTDPDKQRLAIDAFTAPFPDTAELAKNNASPPAFLIVKSMLLTGFDAPVEQVLYLDRSMQGAELLQAVARVNRPADGKRNGYVIDYAGITRHLTTALREYAAEDIEGDLKDLTDQVNRLPDLARRVEVIFTGNGLTPGYSLEVMEDCIQLLADGQLRVQFELELDAFLSTIDVVLPLPAALRYLPQAKLFAEIARQTRRRYREAGDFDPSLYGEKVRELIDEHMTSLGVENVLPPVSITDPDYAAQVGKLSPRARASEMEHAIRHHISVHVDEDPTRYRRLSERLEQILAEHTGNWEQQALALGGLLEEIKDDDAPAGSPALNRVEMALYGLLTEETATDGVPDEQRSQQLTDFTRRLHEMAVRQTTRMDFWRHPVDQDDFIKDITIALITDDIWHAREAPALADKLFEIIKANRGRLRQPGSPQ